MLDREIVAVCSEFHTKHINTLCGQNVEFVHVKPLDLKGWITLGIIRQRGQIGELIIKRFSSSLHWHNVTTTTLDKESTSEGSKRRIFYEAEWNSARRSDVCHFREYQGWHRKDEKCCSTTRNWRNILVPSDHFYRRQYVMSNMVWIVMSKLVRFCLRLAHWYDACVWRK